MGEFQVAITCPSKTTFVCFCTSLTKLPTVSCQRAFPTVSMILTLVLSSLVSVATNSFTMSLKTALGLLSAETMVTVDVTADYVLPYLSLILCSLYRWQSYYYHHFYFYYMETLDLANFSCLVPFLWTYHLTLRKNHLNIATFCFCRWWELNLGHLRSMRAHNS